MPNQNPTPRLPNGQPAWFTPEHNAFLERLLEYPPGAVLDLWQTYLVPAAQLVLRDYAVKPPPAYEQLQGLGIDVGGSGRALHARPGHGPGNLEGLSRRGAVRIPEARRVRVRGEEHDEGGRPSGARAGGSVRRPVAANTAGERVQRGRVGDARNDSGSVSSRTRSRSVRRRGS